MTGPRFAYLAFHDIRGTGRITSVGAYVVSASEPLQGVLWSVPRQRWAYNPGTFARFMFDDNYNDFGQHVDRETAERIAVNLGTRLPSEDELEEMCRVGSAAEHAES